MRFHTLQNVLIFYGIDLDVDLPFSQPVTFAHLEWQRCLAASHDKPLDIAVLGFPYDTSTSYRPGARFGPRGIRAGSAREKKGRSYNTVWGIDPYDEGLEIVGLPFFLFSFFFFKAMAHLFSV